MKKLHVLATIALSTTIQAEHLLESFETSKREAVRAIDKEITQIKTDWDHVADNIKKSQFNAQTLKTANVNIEQHKGAASAIHDDLGKEVKGKTKAKLNDYKTTTATSARTESHHLNKAKHLSEKLSEHLEKAVAESKEEHKKVVSAHDQAQKAVAKADAESHQEDKKHHAHKPEKKDKKKKNDHSDNN